MHENMALPSQEASAVFGDPLAITFEDPDHSVGEQRYITFGLSLYERQLVVAHSDRGLNIRIVSEVAKVFPNDEAVNDALRALIDISRRTRGSGKRSRKIAC